MFKAINKQTHEDIIILDPKWANRLDYLRSLDNVDNLICQQCQQSVRVRAGQVRRWHFAHKYLQDCPLQYESPTLLAARAILYEWLNTKFGSAVTLEKKLDGDLLSRPIDCWIDTRSAQIAYWLIETQIKPPEREILQLEFERLGVKINWVFLTSMLHEDQQITGRIHLTTTERELMQASDYDQIDQDFRREPGQSLHYLDPENENLITFRSLRLIHAPQLHAGRQEMHPMSEMLVSPKTGEFVHPGEFERLQAWREATVQAKKEWEEVQRKRQEQETELLQRRLQYHEGIGSFSSLPSLTLDEWQPKPPSAKTTYSYPQEAICELCGNAATEWYSFNNVTQTCKCMDCYRRLEKKRQAHQP